MTSGVYLIRSTVHPDRMYVGSATNLDRRWYDHISNLKRGEHHSKYMQNHVQKHGVDDLRFEVLRECDVADLIPTEQHFIDTIHPCFNTLPTAGSPLGRKHTDETKRKIGESGRRTKALWDWHPDAETRHKAHVRMRGNAYAAGKKSRLGAVLSPETKQKIGAANRAQHKRKRLIAMYNKSVRIGALKVKVFSDSASLSQIETVAANPLVSGFTTNPTLLKKACVTDYEAFARAAAKAVYPRPISFEVFADDLDEMERQARVIASWSDNINIKIPITNTNGVFTGPVISSLSRAGMRVNVTAVFTVEQVDAACQELNKNDFVSIFAGRIADTGRDPVPLIKYAVGLHGPQVIWASPREVYNVWQANESGCNIITIVPELLEKLPLAGKSLNQLSLDTVKMFHDDAVKAGFTIPELNGYGVGGFGG